MEPTQPPSNYLVSNPYEDTIKADIYGVPIIPPPPPPVKRNLWKIIAIVEAIMILCFYSYMVYSIIMQNTAASGNANKKVISTATSTKQPYTASTLLNMFIADVSRTGAPRPR